MTTAKRLVTADEYLNMPDDGKKYELIRGRLVEKMGTGFPHSIIVFRISGLLFVYMGSMGHGYVCVGEPGYYLERGPDTVRCPDIAWIAPGRVPEGIQGFPALAPDLAIEVKSPSNSRRELAEKAAMWLSFGSREVWVADPETVTVTVYRPGAEPVTLGEDDTLDGGELLPGFASPVWRFFRETP